MLAALGLSLGACTADVAVPGEARMACAEAADCPDGFVCKVALGRCVSATGGDQEPPGVVPGSVVVSPGAARIGRAVTVDFDVTEALLQDPEVVLADPGRPRPLVLEAQDGLHYRFAFAPSGSEAEGTAALTTNLVDLAGNQAKDQSLGTLLLDFQAPAIRDFSVLGTGVLTATGEGRVQFTVSETLAEDPEVHLAGGVALERAPESAPPRYVYVYRARGDEPEGPVRVEVTVADAADNVTGPVPFDAFLIDHTAPGIVPGTAQVLRPAVREGLRAAVSFEVTEPLGAPPVVTMTDPGGAAVELRLSEKVGNVYTYDHEVTSADAEGTYALAVASLVDLAGNDGAVPIALGEVTVDKTAPVVTDLEVTPDRASLVPGFDTVEVRFALAPAADVDRTSIRVEVAGRPADGCGPDGASPNGFVCTFVVRDGDPEGAQSVIATATDPAGNTAVASASVVLDFTAPALLATDVTPASAKLGDTIVYNLVASEPLTDAPTVTVPDVVALTHQTGTTYAYVHTVDGREGTGRFTPLFDLVDEVGNRAEGLAGRDLVIDAEPPRITGPSVTPSRASHEPGHDEVVVGFTVSEDVGTGTDGPQVTLGDGDPLDCQRSGTGPFDYTCSYVLQSADVEGDHEVAVRVSDAAGNRSSAFDGVIFDFTPPTATVEVAPARARLDQTLVYRVRPSEALGPDPILTVTGPSQPFGSSVPTDGAWVWSRTVDDQVAEGAYQTSLHLVDAAGNAADLTGVPFSVDTSVPAVTAVAVSRGKVSRAPGWSTYDVTFEVSEDVGLQAPGLLVTVGTRSLDSCTRSAPTAGTWRYVCPVAVGAGDAEGHYGVTVKATDEAGNVGLGGTSIEYDFTPPGILAVPTVSPPIAKLGDVVSYGVTASEPLGVEPTLAIQPLQPVEPGQSPPSFAYAAGTSYVYEADVTSATASGTYASTLTLRDEAGNEAQVDGATFAIDTSVPEVSDLVVSVDGGAAVAPPRIDESGTVRASFTVSEATDPGQGLLSVTVGGRDMDCARVGTPSGGGADYECTWTMQGDEIPHDTEATQTVLVTARDAAGNRGSASGTVVFDFADPTVTGTVAYLPGPDNPLPVVSAAGADTRVLVTVVADEGLDSRFRPVLEALDGSRTLAFTAPSTLAMAYTSATFEATIDASDLDGTYGPRVTVRDVAGNQVTRALVPTVEVLTSDPVLVVDPDQVVWVRSPWGRDAQEDLGGYQIPAGSYFALEPVDTLGPDTVIPAGAFTEASGRGLVRVNLWDTQDRGALLAALTADPVDGTWPRKSAADADLVAPWVTAVDVAGNESTPVRISHGEWVATPNPSGVGGAPHTLVPIREAGPALLEEAEDLARALTGGRGAGTLTAGSVAYAAWHPITPASLTTPSFPEAAYDPERGSVLVVNDRSTLEWDGRQWLDRTPAAGVPSLTHPRLTFDGNRHRTVLVGQDTGGCRVFEWDGGAWADASPAGPRPPDLSGLTYDPIHGRLVLFAPDGGTWQDDGAGWVQAAATGPSARTSAAMAFDAGAGQVLLFGGYAGGAPLGDLWAWDGTSWSLLDAGGSGPTPRQGAGMAYDPVRGRMVLFGGRGASGVLGDLWEWTGTGWVERTAAAPRPDPRVDAAVAFDAARGELLLFGGYDGWAGLFEDVWSWDGSGWTDRSPSAVFPPALYDAAMAYDVDRGRLVLFGGSLSSAGTWEWDGARWQDVTPATSPSPRRDPAMVYDEARGRVVLYGGTEGSTWRYDTWEWDGTAWTQFISSSTPHVTFPELAYDPLRQRVVLVGASGVTYERNASGTWRSMSSSGPPATYDHVLVYDRAHGEVVLGGGLLVADDTEQPYTWGWNGASWSSTYARQGAGSGIAYDTEWDVPIAFGGYDPWDGVPVSDCKRWTGSVWAPITVGATGPGPWSRHAMAYDGARHEVVVFGGDAGGGGDQMWSLTPPRQPALQLDVSMVDLGVPADAVTGLRVRAWAGGTSDAGDGAALSAWRASGASRPGWMALGSPNGAAANQPGVAAARLDWTASSPTEARQLVRARDQAVSVQLRPRGSTPKGSAGAEVSLQYVEVRVRYRLP